MGKHDGKKDRTAADRAEGTYHAEVEAPGTKPKKIDKEVYEAELAKLQLELVKLQEWVKREGLRVVVVFEGRDAAGEGWRDQAHHRSAQSPYLQGCRTPRCRPTVKPHSGTSSGMSLSFRPRERSCCSTAPGTTAP